MQIEIQYVGGLLKETEILEIRSLADDHGYELKENDVGGKPFADIGEFAGFILSLSPALCWKQLLLGLFHAHPTML
jgi:hypothetical protein